MNRPLRTTIAVAAMGLAAQAAQAQIYFYDREGMRGHVFSTDREVRNFMRVGFNDRASSVIVEHGQWEVCDDADFRGQCMILRRGTYDSLYSMGMNNRISSVRPVAHREHYDNEVIDPPQDQAYEYRRRPSEMIFQARVTSAHAVLGADEQRCWVERQQVHEPARNNVGGAVLGAVIGGVLGHQVGGGTGRDVATAGGAVAGAAIGANAGNGANSYAQDVRRCESVPSTTPSYWDVRYNFHGVEHRVQTATAPGPTISVNRDGEPRQ